MKAIIALYWKAHARGQSALLPIIVDILERRTKYTADSMVLHKNCHQGTLANGWYMGE